MSKKYGVRAHARYPIFWGLEEILSLPNPDPSDTAKFNQKLHDSTTLEIDESFEDERPVLRRQAQECKSQLLDVPFPFCVVSRSGFRAMSNNAWKILLRETIERSLLIPRSWGTGAGLDLDPEAELMVFVGRCT